MANSETGSLKPFHFKQFSINHQQSSMPVGTDAVLLGASITLNKPERILDVGTGCGVLALIMAQRLPTSQIDAIDIDLDSIIEAEQNFLNSPWSNRLNGSKTSFQEYNNSPYDLIISNPPYYQNSYPIRSESRRLARSQEQLTFTDFLINAERLLNPQGEIAVVLPQSTVFNFIEIAQQRNFHLYRRIEVSANNKKPISLNVIQLKRKPSKVTIKKLFIRVKGKYSVEYLKLMKPYYLFA